MTRAPGASLAEVPWEPWMDDPERACAGAPTDVFFGGGSGARAAAETYCARCPVIMLCGEWALGIGGYLFGVWGGMTQEDRRRVKRLRAERRAG